MAWKECDRVSLRREFVSLASVEGAKFSVLCERFGISRKTGYKWLLRFQEGGEADLADRSRRPHTFRSPTVDEVEQAVLAVREGTQPGAAVRFDVVYRTSSVRRFRRQARLRRFCIGMGESVRKSPRSAGQRSALNEPSPMHFGRWISRASSR